VLCFSCALITVALWNRADYYIFALWFLLSFFFFPRLISAVGDWMTAILPHMVWHCGLSANLGCRSETCCTRLAENAGRKKLPKIAICAPSYKFVGLYLRNWGTYRQSEKKLVKQQYLLQMFSQYGELWPTSSWYRSGSLGHPANLNGFRVLAALLHGSQLVGVSQTLRRWTEGASYVRQGDNHVGHWPTF